MEEEEEARRSWPSGREAGGLFRSGTQRCGSSSASLGAMRSLVGKLDTLLLAPPSPPPAMGCYSERVMDLMRLLRDDVEAICSYLDDLSQVEDPPATASCWMNDTRDLSYDMEDYIDSLLSVPPTPLADTSANKNKKKITSGPVKIPKRLKWCKQMEYTAQVSENGKATGSVRRNIRVMITTRLRRKRPNIIVEAPEMISEFRMYLQEAIDRHHRYELHCCSYLKRPGFLMPTSRRLLPSQEADSHVVTDERMNEFINSLPANEAADEQQLKVVSVLGHGCLGKTTLAKVSYDRIGVQFDCRAFVQVSENPDMKRLARDLFSQLGRKQSTDDCNALDNIIDGINKQLQDKRYLIVIDDLRAASVWDIIKHAFPKGNLGSRIVTTTQIEDVALACCGHQREHVFEMKPLDDDHSRKLFFDRLFGSETDCPEELKLVSAEIVEICGGLPLATISIASLLAKQPSISVDLLTRMRGSLSSILSSSPASERTRQALNLSYNNLPRYLKTCLMYVTMYPEGSIIFKHDLVKQLVAEGFIVTREGESMEKVAGMHFDELVDRRFIQLIHHRYDGEVVSCTVHDVVRDLIAHKSAQENFTVVVDYDRDDIPLCHKARRLSLQLGDAKYAKTPSNIRKSQVRSLGFFGLLECMPCVGEFKLLRLLNIQIFGRRRRRRRGRGDSDHDDLAVDLTGISELFHLRYLKIASDASIQLPDRMRGLQCLETLDTTRVTAVPWDIIHLPHLLHLSAPLDTNLLDCIGSMSSSDAVISLWSLGKLHSLQDLHLTPSPSSSSPPSSSDRLERCMEALGSLLGGHGNLKTLVVAPRDDRNASGAAVIICWDGLAPPPLLERFEFSRRSGYMFARIPMWMGQLGNLRVLKIAVRELLRPGVDILRGLPALTALSLHVQSPPVEWVVFGKQGFSALNYLKFSCGVPWLRFEAGAMPSLRKIKLGFSAPDQDQHGSISIDHLPGLKEISAKIGGDDADADADALRIVVSNHPSNPSIKVQLVDSAFYGDKSDSRASRPPGPSLRLNLPGLIQHDLKKIIDEQETHDLSCPNCSSCVTRSVMVILRKRKAKQTVGDERPTKQQIAAPSGNFEEYDLEKILDGQETHDLYCPNCNSCITRRVILRRTKRQPSSTDSAEKPVLSNTLGRGPDAPSAPSREQRDAALLRMVYTSFVDLMTRLFPAVATAPALSSCHLQASNASYVQQSHHATVAKSEQSTKSFSEHQTTVTTTTTTTSSTTTSAAAGSHTHTSSATGIFHADVTEVIAGQLPSPRRPYGGAIMDATHHLLGHEGHTPEFKVDCPISTNIVRGDIPTSLIPQAGDPPHVAVSVSEDVSPAAPTAGQRDILKAIVYGGLVGSVSSLCVVSGAASCGAKTLHIFMLGIVILIGGLPLTFHHMAGLRNLGNAGGNEEEVEHYRLQLGRRPKLWLHMVLALLSYIIFGLLPPVLYGLSFRESENKMMAVAAASLACISLLALGKARLQRRPRAYIKTLMYYLMFAVSSSGLSYAAGMLMTWLLVHFGLIHQGASAPPSLSSFPADAVGGETSAWASF